MRNNIYNIRDNRAQAFGTPIFTFMTPDQISESYKDTIAKMKLEVQLIGDPANANEWQAKKLMQASQLQDCTLYLVGEFDPETGAFKIFDYPELVADLKEYWL